MKEEYSLLMLDAAIQVDASSITPVYRQIVDQFRLHLNSGALLPGTQLPSVRSLAAQLGVHFNTIAEAYRELAQEGWIDLAHGRRATVLQRSATSAIAPGEANMLRQRLRHLLAEMLLKGVSAATIHRDIQTILPG